MAQFKAFAPGVQVNGETVLSVVSGFGTFRESALRVLAEHKIVSPQLDHWYAQQDWLDSFQTISEQLGVTALLGIGRKVPESAKWPPEVKTLEQAMASIDVAYHMNHRGGNIGYYRFETTGPRSGKMVCQNPYPCDFDRGIIDAVARKFKPSDTAIANVTHDDTQPCRKNGADSCTYLISW